MSQDADQDLDASVPPLGSRDVPDSPGPVRVLMEKTHTRGFSARSLLLLVGSLALLGTPLEALAHGYAAGDAGYIQEMSGVHAGSRSTGARAWC